MRTATRLLLGLLTIPILLAAGDAAAQIFPDADLLGMYFDTQGISIEVGATPYTMVSVYLLLTHPATQAPVDGWECAIYPSPDPIPTGMTVTLAGDGVNAATPPNYRVSIATPLPFAPRAITLATLRFFYTYGPWSFSFGPATPSVFPAAPVPAYHAVGEAGWRAAPGYLPSGRPPCTYLGCCLWSGCMPTPVEQSSWSAVKGLYN